MDCPPHIRPFVSPGRRVAATDLETLLGREQVVEAQKRTGAAKVICCATGHGAPLMVKLWYPKRELSSTWLNPYPKRFRRNATEIRSRGFPAPNVRGWGAVAATGIRFVTYDRLPGRPLRELKPAIDLAGIGVFVARLHDAGIDFRSLHMGNILRDTDGTYSLIDVTDCSFPRRFPLKRRASRLGYFCGHRMEQHDFQANDAWMPFLRSYCERAGLDPDALRPLVGQCMRRTRARDTYWDKAGRAGDATAGPAGRVR